MKLKFHNRALPRIAVAGFLTAFSCSSMAAETQKPGTLASAQAKSHAAATPAPGAPVPTPPTKGANNFAPGTPAAAHAGAAGAANVPGVPAQPEGRLKPKIIYPEGQYSGDMQGPQGGGSYRGQGGSGPGASPRTMQPGQMGQNGSYGAPAVGMGGAFGPSVPAGPSSNPFAPASPSQATGMQNVGGPGQRGAVTPKKPAASTEDGPSINVQCTTPEIKAQGVFVGKIQNRYVYKYKSQYCFDLEP